MSKPRFKLVDLFAGAGGLTLGMKWAGLEPVLAVERENDFARTYAENFGRHCLARDIESLVESGTMHYGDAATPTPAENGWCLVLDGEEFTVETGRRT